MDFLEVFAISGAVNGFITLGLGIFIISNNWRDKVNRLYFFLVLATCLWSFSYWRWLSSDSAADAIFWVRMLSVGSILIPISYFHWIVSLLKIEKSQKLTVRLFYILGLIFLSVSFTDLFIINVSKKLFFPFWPNPGVLYHFYLFVLYILLVIYSARLITKHYKNAQNEDERKRLAYVFVGSVLAFTGGLSNFFLWYNIPIIPYGNFLVAFYPFLFGYATIRYRLFNIKTMATELFIIAIWVFLIIKILISTSFNDLVANMILFLAIIFFGILLMRSAAKEQKQKEQMEIAYKMEKLAKEDLEAIDKSKNQFLLAIQHHLRTPLTAIMGYSDLILNGTFGKQKKDTLSAAQNIQISAKNLIKMANEFLDVTQFQLGKNIIELKDNVDMWQVLNEIASELQLEADKKGIYLQVEKNGKEALIKADREKIKAAIYNIVDNAVKYTKEGGVTVGIEWNSGLKIFVKDTGLGMTQEQMKNTFSKTFERGEEAKRTFANGRGIGLYITKQIVSAHKGQIWAESQGPGKGSKFIIELPY